MEEFHPRHIYCFQRPKQLPKEVAFTAMEDMALLEEVDLVMVATMGSVGLVPTLNALKQGKLVALSNTAHRPPDSRRSKGIPSRVRRCGVGCRE